MKYFTKFDNNGFVYFLLLNISFDSSPYKFICITCHRESLLSAKLKQTECVDTIRYM